MRNTNQITLGHFIFVDPMAEKKNLYARCAELEKNGTENTDSQLMYQCILLHNMHHNNPNFEKIGKEIEERKACQKGNGDVDIYECLAKGYYHRRPPMGNR